MTPPAREKPSVQSKRPVRPALMPKTIRTGVSKSSAPLAARGPTTAAANAAVTAAVEPSGPAIMNGTELRTATVKAPTAVVIKVAAMP